MNVFKNVLTKREISFHRILTISQASPGFYVFAVQVFCKHCGKGEMARDNQFLLFPQCFLSFWRKFSRIYQI